MFAPLCRAASLLVIGTSLSLNAMALMPSNPNCADPAYSNMPSCDNRGAPKLPSAADHEKRLEKQDAIRCNKAKQACMKKPVTQRQKCLQQVQDNMC